MIGIMGAMQAEVDSLMCEIKDLKMETVSGYDFARGTLGSHEVVVVKCGVGKVNAAVGCQTMILTYHPEVIINTGVAGSLSPELDILDVAVATDAVQHDYDTSAIGRPSGELTLNGELVTHLPCDAAWREKLIDAAGRVGVKAIPARIASGDQFISRAEDKRRIVERFGAMACEMEGGAIAQTCFLAHTPCAILRAISDSTDDNHSMEFEMFLSRAVENTYNILMEVLK